MRKVAFTLLAAVLAVATLSAGGSAQSGKVAMLLPGSINDQSWNAAGYGGLQKLKAEGMEIAYSENVQAADHIEAMKDYARRGFSPIIGHSGRFLSAAQRVGPEFEKTFFLVGSGSGGAKNVISVDLANEQFAYLVGVLAGRMTKTGKVGAVAGLEGLPNMIASMGGFRLGVKSVKPDAEVRIIYLQSMEDPAAAKEATFSLISAGADVVGGQAQRGPGRHRAGGEGEGRVGHGTLVRPHRHRARPRAHEHLREVGRGLRRGGARPEGRQARGRLSRVRVQHGGAAGHHGRRAPL